MSLCLEVSNWRDDIRDWRKLCVEATAAQLEAGCFGFPLPEFRVAGKPVAHNYYGLPSINDSLVLGIFAKHLGLLSSASSSRVVRPKWRTEGLYP